jgi:class 3 adenylate cyclase/tetratricopeptide (TPR) repeat protein
VCSHEVEPADKFCSNCGSPLGASESGAEPGDDLSRYLPEELLTKMRSAREGKAMLGERRTVTMLFADITGSTAAAEQLDPEDWAEIMNGAFEHLIAPVYRYEGTLAQLRGDAILAFFGAPIAHEDDPIRALRAGVEMVDAMSEYSREVEEQRGFPVQVRVGINTGLVVVGEMGSDLRVEYSALGDAINVAARMEQTADPGTVRVTEHTLSLTGSAFAVQSLGGVEVKGKRETVPAYRVLGFVGSESPGEDLPMVGREAELGLLEDAANRLRSGSGWVFSITADGGVGKSRLIEAFRQRLGATASVVSRFDEAGDVAWMSGSSRSYDASNPFSTIREMARTWWGVGQDDDGFEAVQAACSSVGVSDPDIVALLANLAGFTLPDSARRFVEALETPVLHSRSGEAVSTYLEATAQRVPTIVVIEDLHWADDLSLALIEDMMGLSETSSFGLVMAMRPYRDEPPWRLHEVADREHPHRYHHLSLAPLGDEESIALLDTLMGERALPADVRDKILERSDGNPLFIEEIVRSLSDEEKPGVPQVPSNLTGILTARLDRLGDQVRYMVQVASVLGSEFDRDTLMFLVGTTSTEAQVAELLRKGILVESGGVGGTLTFRHALIQETAYETILRRTRRELHRRVADHLVEVQPDAVPDIARHLVDAGDIEDAFPYLVEAARRASRSMALADAIRLLEMALEHVPPDAEPALVEAAHETLGEAYALVPDLSQAAASYQRLYEYGEEADRPRARISALNRLAYATATIGADLDGASKYLLDAKTLAEETGDEIGLAEYHMNACLVASMAGQVGTAVAHDEATVELGEKSGVSSIYISGLLRRALNYITLVDLEKGVPAVETAAEQVREMGNEEGIALVDSLGRGLVGYIEGDVRTALETAEQAQPTLERFASFYMALNQRNAGSFLFELGDLEGALSRFVDTIRIATRMGQLFVAGSGSSGMALVYATAGMASQAIEQRGRAVEATQNPMGEFMGSTIWADVGFVDLELGDAREALADFARGLEAASTSQHLERPRLLAGQALARMATGDFQGARADLDQAWDYAYGRAYVPPRTLLGYAAGVLETATGRLESADQTLDAAQQSAMDMGQRPMIARILEARARVAQLSNDAAAADAHSTAAREVVEAIGESIADDDLRTSFLGARSDPMAGLVEGA